MRVLVVTNLYPAPDSPRRGRFVRDQVEALRQLGAEVETFTFPLGARAYPRAVPELRRLLRRERFDVVHAHYGLCGWVARRAGARPLVVTFHGTDVRHRLSGAISRRLARRIDLAAGASLSVFRREGGRRGLPLPEGHAAVLPCGVDTERFAPRPRQEARRRLGLDPGGRYLAFPADPARQVKRHDRAAEVAKRAEAELLVAGEVDPERMPDLLNAASAVLVTSDSEGFGLSVLEALACRVPVLSTPVGIAPLVLADMDGCLASPFDPGRWAEQARRHLQAPDPRTGESPLLARLSAGSTAARVNAAYEGLVARHERAREASGGVVK